MRDWFFKATGCLLESDLDVALLLCPEIHNVVGFSEGMPCIRIDGHTVKLALSLCGRQGQSFVSQGDQILLARNNDAEVLFWLPAAEFYPNKIDNKAYEKHRSAFFAHVSGAQVKAVIEGKWLTKSRALLIEPVDSLADPMLAGTIGRKQELKGAVQRLASFCPGQITQISRLDLISLMPSKLAACKPSKNTAIVEARQLLSAYCSPNRTLLDELCFYKHVDGKLTLDEFCWVTCSPLIANQIFRFRDMLVALISAKPQDSREVLRLKQKVQGDDWQQAEIDIFANAEYREATEYWLEQSKQAIAFYEEVYKKASLLLPKFQTAQNAIAKVVESYQSGSRLQPTFERQDQLLVEHWLNEKVAWQGELEFVPAKLMSARRAETGVLKLFPGAVDTSVSQISDTPGDWRNTDITFGDVCIDVKNARVSYAFHHCRDEHKVRYSEFCIPPEKSRRSQRSGVVYVGVLSEYKRDFVELNNVKPRLLGAYEPSYIDAVQQSISQAGYGNHLNFYQRDNKRVPGWLFSFENMPGFICADHSLVVDWFKTIKPIAKTERSFVSFYLSLLSKHKHSLTSLYMAVVAFVLQSPAELVQRAQALHRLLVSDVVETNESEKDARTWAGQEKYYGRSDSRTVLVTYDPLGFLIGMLDALVRVGEAIQNLNYPVTYFRYEGVGLLIGHTQARKSMKLLAYCGGKSLEVPLANCGYEPLVVGEHQNCPACGYLICPKCGTCSPSCAVGALRRQQLN
ncbi:hypothetical protein [Salinibius halmophilus]|uniref:hypothetical protein n=1 Tax=Salinibius halmophilus TaxID=1853216 RepID=UPI000E66AF33|nr:hypothetical protein [Salinibius halmophilus]